VPLQAPQPESTKVDFISYSEVKDIVPSNGAYLTLSDIKEYLNDDTETPQPLEFQPKAIFQRQRQKPTQASLPTLPPSTLTDVKRTATRQPLLPPTLKDIIQAVKEALPCTTPPPPTLTDIVQAVKEALSLLEQVEFLKGAITWSLNESNSYLQDSLVEALADH
jgi:hypothetical protein